MFSNKGTYYSMHCPNYVRTRMNNFLVFLSLQRMFDLAVESGASINIQNNLKMTPLTVAAYLARQEMFFHIANIEREVYWQIGNVCCSAYPIEQLDTINSSTGELNMQSALNLIVFGVSYLTGLPTGIFHREKL